MIGACLGLVVALAAQAPTLAPRDTQLVVAFPPDLQALQPELLARYALYGQRYFERTFGRRAASAWSSDRRDPPPQLQQILKLAGLSPLGGDTAAKDSAQVVIFHHWGDRPLEHDAEPLITAEMLAALDTSPYPRAALEAAWRVDSLATAAVVRDRAFGHLAADLDTRGTGIPIVVFNPATWVRSAAVAVPLDSTLRELGKGTSELRITDAARRSQAASRDGDSLRFIAREVPPVGFKVFWLRTGRAAAGASDTITGRAGAPMARRVDERAGLAGHSWSFLSLDAANVRIAALKRGEQTNARVLRLMEWKGEAATVTLTFGPRLTRVRLANLLEDPLQTLPLPPSGRSVTLTLRPWDIVTLLLEEAR